MKLGLSLNRRRFLQVAGVVGARVSLGELPWRCARAAERGAAPPAPSWVERPMRWAQLTLVRWKDSVQSEAEIRLWVARRSSDGAGASSPPKSPAWASRGPACST